MSLIYDYLANHGPNICTYLGTIPLVVSIVKKFKSRSSTIRMSYTNVHLDRLQKEIEKLSRDQLGGERRISDNIISPRLFLKKIIDEGHVADIYDLCEDYIKSTCDLSVCKNNIKYGELKEKSKSFQLSSQDVFDTYMTTLIPLFSIVIFDTPSATELLILKELSSIQELLINSGIGKDYEFFENNLSSVISVITNWKEIELFKGESNDHEERVRVLCYSLLMICERRIQDIIKRSASKLIHDNIEQNCFALFRNFISHEENTFTEISDAILSSVRELRKNNMPMDDRLRSDIIGLILLIGLLKEKSINNNVVKLCVNGCEKSHYECQFHSKKLVDLDVIISFFLPKRIDINNIDEYYSEVSCIEGGIGDKSSIDDFSYPETITAVMNAFFLTENNERKIVSIYQDAIDDVTDRSRRILKDDVPSYLIAVLPYYVGDSAIEKLVSIFPSVVIVRRMKGDNHLCLLNEKFIRQFSKDINADLKVKGIE
ncbi:hypothetical protein [Desulfovibrio inopinatus]|uniref:hypothetical protein n=1 Tax=Desulfovibrio inopinatus TaxID=102109 RepID=UPI0004183D6E|nr:hypothetical protein [Desulfovibrio inopinatus]